VNGSEPAAGAAATNTRRRLSRATAILHRFRTEGGDTPIRQALAIGLGLFIGASPFFGFHLLLTLVLGRLFALNRLKVYFAAHISNPLIAPLLIAAEIQAAALLRTGRLYDRTMLAEATVRGLAGDVLLGSVVVGLALATVGTLVTYWITTARRVDPRVRRLADSAAERFLPLGISRWEFARSKLVMDDVYLRVLRDGILPSSGTLVDLGCGHGLMLSLLDAARVHYGAGDWPPDWPPPPVDLDLCGIELRPRVAARAREVLEDAAAIESLDASSASLPLCRAVLIFDVLHLMSAADQTRVLTEVRRALTPDGVLVLREANAAGGLRFQTVRLGNRLVALLTGHARRPFEFRSKTAWQDLLRNLGFDVLATHASGDGPFANFSVYARAPREAAPATSPLVVRE
jgi:uncharacterized protein (DUF2062 family)